MKKITLLLSLLIFTAWPLLSHAGPQVGTLTDISGSVQIFSNPSTKGPQGPPPHARYEGAYYSVTDAKIGQRVEKGNFVRTRPGARARIIFDNGDQFYVAPATFFRVNWDRDTADAHPEVELGYGKSRFVITQGGPRSKFRVRTKQAVMGVRGTDFFVAVNDTTGATETATLRGAVEVKPELQANGKPEAATSTAASKPQLVTSGQTASVAETRQVELHQITQDDLKAVARNSEITPSSEPVAAPEVQARIKTLEAAAAESTLQDIRKGDPALAAKLDAHPEKVTAMNDAVLAKLETTASTESYAGPIADVRLEAGKTAQAAPAPEAEANKPEEPPHILPLRPFWFGVRVATGSSRAVLGGAESVNTTGSGNCGGFNQPSCLVQAQSNGSKDSGQVALQGEYMLSPRFSVLAELLPYVTDGAQGLFGSFQCGGFCNGSGPFDRIDTSSTRLNAMAKWNYPVFGGQRLGLDLAAGPGINFLTQATFPDNGKQSITSSFNTVSMLVTGSVGIHERIGDRFRLGADFRISRGITNMASSSGIFVNGTSYYLVENSLGLALSYQLGESP